MQSTQHPSEEPNVQCPFELIITSKQKNGHPLYYVKYYNKKYADSVWLTREQITEYPEGKTISNRNKNIN